MRFLYVKMHGILWGRGYLVLSGALWGFLELSGGVWGCLGLSGAIWGCLGLSGAVWGCLGCLGLSGAIWGLTSSNPLGLVRSNNMRKSTQDPMDHCNAYM